LQGRVRGTRKIEEVLKRRIRSRALQSKKKKQGTWLESKDYDKR
jgi:hypothetical protein